MEPSNDAELYAIMANPTHRAFYLDRSLFNADNLYDSDVAHFLEKFDLLLEYYSLCRVMASNGLKSYGDYSDQIKHFIQLVNDQQATVLDFINLDKKNTFTLMKQHIEKCEGEKYDIQCLGATGGAHLFERFRRARSNEFLIDRVMQPFGLEYVEQIHILSMQSGPWTQYIIHTPHYKYGIRPTLADMPRYREILATEDPFELDMIRKQALAYLPSDLYNMLPNMPYDDLHELCSKGSFYLVFDDIREYRALIRLLNYYVNRGFHEDDLTYQAIHKQVMSCNIVNLDVTCLTRPFNKTIYNPLYICLRYSHVIERIAMAW